MPRYTSTRAWDDFWTHTNPVHLLGSQHVNTKSQDEFIEAAEGLLKARLSTDSIGDIANAALSAYRVGREETNAYERKVMEDLASAIRVLLDTPKGGPNSAGTWQAAEEFALNTLRRVTPT